MYNRWLCSCPVQTRVLWSPVGNWGGRTRFFFLAWFRVCVCVCVTITYSTPTHQWIRLCDPTGYAKPVKSSLPLGWEWVLLTLGRTLILIVPHHQELCQAGHLWDFCDDPEKTLHPIVGQHHGREPWSSWWDEWQEQRAVHAGPLLQPQERGISLFTVGYCQRTWTLSTTVGSHLMITFNHFIKQQGSQKDKFLSGTENRTECSPAEGQISMTAAGHVRRPRSRRQVGYCLARLALGFKGKRLKNSWFYWRGSKGWMTIINVDRFCRCSLLKLPIKPVSHTYNLDQVT